MADQCIPIDALDLPAAEQPAEPRSHALGQSISTVELTPTGGEFKPFAPTDWESVPENRERFRDAVLQSLGPQHIDEMLPTMVSLSAGLAAQRRLIGRAHDDYADHDINQCEAIARAVTNSPLAACNLVAHAMEQAEQIVDRHWHAIEALAGELLLRRKLDAGQIRDVIVLGPAARRRKSWDQIVAQTKAAFGGALVSRSW
jgi:hypothetical protein